MPTAVSTGAARVSGPTVSGALTSVRPNSSPNPDIPTPTATASTPSVSVRHASSSADAVPTRKTISPGTSRLRYEPTGRSTVRRSFQPNSAPAISSPSPCSSWSGGPRRDGTASGTPTSSTAAVTSPAAAHPFHCRQRTSTAIPAPMRDAAATSTTNESDR